MTKQEYEEKVLRLKGTHDYDMLCFIRGEYISSLEAEKERLRSRIVELENALDKAIDVIYEETCFCPLLEVDTCMFPPDGCDYMDKDSSKGCWRQYLMGDK